MTQLTTALLYHPIYLKHETGGSHPERPSRLEAILRQIKKSGIIARLKIVEPESASIEDIALVHSKEYILSIKEICSRLACARSNNNDIFAKQSGGARSNNNEIYSSSESAEGGRVEKNIAIDPDTIVSKDSYDAALFAVGGVLKGIDLVMDKKFDNAFCLVRPPGHHALQSQAMGFCIFNNVAIGARYIQKKYNLNRVLIIDWDVHHGNGTEQAFYNDPTVFYISLHQYPHYPGTGASGDTGEGKGKGFNLNIPMRAGSSDEEYIKAFNDLIIPKASDFKPEFILLSAGFDGHKDDPLSNISLTENGYRKMTEFTKDLAFKYAEERIVSVLEGGYNLTSLAKSVDAHINVLYRDNR